MNTNKIKLNKNNELSPLIKYMVVKKKYHVEPRLFSYCINVLSMALEI